ncbi:hypothetical protein GF351_05390 [Candidatus Woesearchaeota archaeon]|nr:hypothetical protein [Candidatus Woesearchaeota archaeon]
MGMYGWVDLKDKIRQYFSFSREETKAVIISILVVTFIVSFREWGTGTEIQFGAGLYNFFNALLVSALVVLIHISAQRIMGLHVGFRVEYKLWIYGVVISLVVCLLTRGYVWILIPGGIFAHHLAVHRLGYFRYGLNMLAFSFVAMAGSLANIALAIILRGFLHFMPTNILLYKAMIVSLWYAVLNMLPIPPLDGSRLFFTSRLTYAYVFGSILGAAIFLTIKIHVILAILFSLILGGMSWLVFYIMFEKSAWKGPGA